MGGRFFLVAAVVLAACGEAEDAALPDGGVVPVQADASLPAADAGQPAADAGVSPDESDRLFPQDRLIRVELELDPADWDSLRAETRTWEETLGKAECLAEPFESPFNYYPASVVVDGVRVERAAVRKKGFLGSLSTAKPSLKVSFDELVPEQELFGLDALTLNNGRQDPSLIKPCIGYALFRSFGLPAPRCNYAEVFVNGERAGIYVHVESIKKRFLRRWFASDEGGLWEGTLSDFRDGWMGTFEAKNDETVALGTAALEELATAAEAPDATLIEALENTLDLEQFLSFWAMEVFIQHWDGYAGNTNNYYLYDDPSSGLINFLPWGIDGILGDTNAQAQPQSVLAQGILARRLYFHAEGKQRYLERLEEVVANHGDPAELAGAVDRAAAVVVPALTPAERSTVEPAIAGLRTFVRGRAAQLERELSVGGGVWTQPLRASICFEPLGDLTLTMVTRWGTHPAANPFETGTGTFTATLAGARLGGVQVGASAGLGDGPDDLGDSVFIGAAILPSGVIAVTYLVAEPGLAAPGVTLPIDTAEVRGALLQIPRPGAPLELVGLFSGGRVEWSDFEATPGAPVALRLEASVITFPR